MANQNAEAHLLNIPFELRESIFEHVLTFETPLYLLPYEISFITDVSATIYETRKPLNLEKVDLALLTVSKQAFIEALAIFQKHNRLYAQRMNFLGDASNYAPSLKPLFSNWENQIRHFTLKGDTRIYDLVSTTLWGVDDMLPTNNFPSLRHLSIHKRDFAIMFPEELIVVEIEQVVSKRTGRQTMKKITGRLTPQHVKQEKLVRHKTMEDLLLRLLHRNDGVLRIMGQNFLDSFQIFGSSKGTFEAGEIRGLIHGVQPKCIEIAKSGRCVYEPEEMMVGNTKVSVGYTISGITTVRLL